MSIAKSGVLINSYKYFTIAVDSFDNRLLKGRLCHDSMEEGASFSCLSEMALALEGLFERIQYPMRSVQQRNFNPKAPVTLPGEILCESRKEGRDKTGILANFRIQVKYRFYASWQGEITDLRDETTRPFASFIELMDYLEERLGGSGADRGTGPDQRDWEAAVRGGDPYVIGGDVSRHSAENQRIFINEFELKEEIEKMIGPLSGIRENTLLIPRTLQVYAVGGETATFVVRVLFWRNGTWQGTICWKERRTQVSFRSFLEMLLLMHEAVNHGEGWKEEGDSLDNEMA